MRKFADDGAGSIALDGVIYPEGSSCRIGSKERIGFPALCYFAEVDHKLQVFKLSAPHEVTYAALLRSHIIPSLLYLPTDIP